MEYVSAVVNSFLQQPLLYILTVLILCFFIKKGLFRLDIKGVHIGRTQELERRIIAAQIDYSTLAVDSIANEMCLKLPNINEYHTKYVLEKVLDEFVRRITLNHISEEKAFIEDVFITVLAIVRKRCKDDFFYGQEFETYCRDRVEEIIKHLHDIRVRLSK